MEKTLSKEEIIAEWRVVEAAKADPAHFGILYERYFRAIFLFIFRRVDQEEVSGDLTSEVFLKALLNLSKIEFRGLPFKAWLYRIASNEVNLHFRNKANERTVNYDKTDIERVIAETTGTMEMTEAQENILAEELQHLDEKDMQLIEMRFFEKIPFAEIAFALGLTETNAKVKLHRILGKLGQRLKKKFSAE